MAFNSEAIHSSIPNLNKTITRTCTSTIERYRNTGEHRVNSQVKGGSKTKKTSLVMASEVYRVQFIQFAEKILETDCV